MTFKNKKIKGNRLLSLNKRFLELIKNNNIRVTNKNKDTMFYFFSTNDNQ